ncbi:MAG: hypothetical protein ACM3O7_02470 [Acidobacteriota bacterium]
MPRKSIVLAAAATVLAATAFSTEPTRWLNVHVMEKGDKTEVRLHVPFSLVLAVVDSVRTADFRDGQVDLKIEGCSVDWPTVLRELRGSPEGDYLTVKSPDADVVVTKKGGVVAVDVTQRGAERAVVKMRLPVELLDAITVDDHSRLDLKGLLSRLDRVTTGDVLSVVSDDADVRVWVE